PPHPPLCPYTTLFRSAVYERLRILHAAFRDRYAERKAARSVLDFADLELEALALLEADPALRTAQHARFRHVLVDEFQDTNPLQDRKSTRLNSVTVRS